MRNLKYTIEWVSLETIFISFIQPILDTEIISLITNKCEAEEQFDLLELSVVLPSWFSLKTHTISLWDVPDMIAYVYSNTTL